MITSTPYRLCLHCLSSGDFVPALEQFPGNSSGPSPAMATRLAQQGQVGHTAFMDRNLSGWDYVCGPITRSSRRSQRG